MGGNKLDSAAVRKLEKLPTKKQLIGSVAIMVKKVGRSPAMYMFHSIMTSRPGCK